MHYVPSLRQVNEWVFAWQNAQNVIITFMKYPIRIVNSCCDSDNESHIWAVEPNASITSLASAVGRRSFRRPLFTSQQQDAAFDRPASRDEPICISLLVGAEMQSANLSLRPSTLRCGSACACFRLIRKQTLKLRVKIITPSTETPLTNIYYPELANFPIYPVKSDVLLLLIELYIY